MQTLLRVQNGAVAKQRLAGLDVLRVLLMLTIFLFHASQRMDCDFGVLTTFLQNGNVVMIGFFALSGFVLGYRYAERDLLAWERLSRFYVRHFLRLMPLYWLYILAYSLLHADLTLKQNLVLAPVEFAGAQAMVTDLFGVAHNGGTWFVSCLLFCYLVFPLMLEVLRRCAKSKNRLFLAAAALLLLYASMRTSATMFSLPEVYSNPFCRAIEFGFGVGVGLIFAGGG